VDTGATAQAILAPSRPCSPGLKPTPTPEMGIVIPEVLRAVTLRPAGRRPARMRREAVTFVPHNGARCVVTTRNQTAVAQSARDGGVTRDG
jgi:hypothetical protein